MKVTHIIAALELFAPTKLQEDWDNAGLLTGDKTRECTGVLCSLDVTGAVVAEAIEKGCNLIIAHHPVLFTGLKRITGNSYTEQVLVEAIKKDIAIYAAHTNLDNIIDGVNGTLAKKLKLQQVAILAPKTTTLRKLVTFVPAGNADEVRNAMFAAGGGHIGRYSECSFNTVGKGTFKAGKGTHPYVGEEGSQHVEDETKIEIIVPAHLEGQVVNALVESHPYEEVAYDIFTVENVHAGIGSGIIGELTEPVSEEEFLKIIKDTCKAKVVRHTALLQKPVRKVALCGGAGSFLTKKAIEQGADFYITSDVKYHEFFDADGRLVLADVGHFESEQHTTDLFYDLLVEKFPNFAVLKTDVNTNPVQYFL